MYSLAGTTTTFGATTYSPTYTTRSLQASSVAPEFPLGTACEYYSDKKKQWFVAKILGQSAGLYEVDVCGVRKSGVDRRLLRKSTGTTVSAAPTYTSPQYAAPTYTSPQQALRSAPPQYAAPTVTSAPTVTYAAPTVTSAPTVTYASPTVTSAPTVTYASAPAVTAPVVETYSAPAPTVTYASAPAVTAPIVETYSAPSFTEVIAAPRSISQPVMRSAQKNLLAMGNVISERVISVEEMASTGHYFEEETVREEIKAPVFVQAAPVFIEEVYSSGPVTYATVY